jgi:hypothetical protein
MAERDAAVVLAAGAIARARATVAADKAYDTRDFVATLRALGLTPHLTQNTTKQHALDALAAAGDEAQLHRHLPAQRSAK